MSKHNTLSQSARQTRTGSAGWMIQVLAGLLNRDMQARLGDIGLKQEHFILLMTLCEQDDLSQTALGQKVHLANYAVTRALDTLEALALVERRPDETSRRTHRVFMTEAGRALMPDLFELVSGLNAEFLTALDPDEQRDFLRLLAKLVAANRPATT